MYSFGNLACQLLGPACVFVCDYVYVYVSVFVFVCVCLCVVVHRLQGAALPVCACVCVKVCSILLVCTVMIM